jgi:hypothetical protein
MVSTHLAEGWSPRSRLRRSWWEWAVGQCRTCRYLCALFRRPGGAALQRGLLGPANANAATRAVTPTVSTRQTPPQSQRAEKIVNLPTASLGLPAPLLGVM